MKKFDSIISLSVLLMLFLSLPMAAQKPKSKTEKVDSIPLKGYIYDRLTTKDIVGAKVQVLRPDSSVISTVKGGYTYYDYNNGQFKKDSTSKYETHIPRKSGDYIIKVTMEGYTDTYMPYVAEIGKRVSDLKAPKIYMSRQTVHQLDEVTVKASKIKFYHKGDTLVYNPEAFILPEGSMLDALVAQMPGVEIKGNKIYVNGRFVESLLLNGKDFFKGNQAVAMQNIGAYAVKDVAVYEKKDEMGKVLGDREDIKEELVMDVRLKKDYMAGTSLNMDAGYGTKGRYIGRLFALGYTNNARVSVYGNTNNINKTNNLGEDSQNYVMRDLSGISQYANGGLDYMLDNPTHTWELSGNADVNYVDGTEESTSFSKQFLQDASNFLSSDSKSNSRNLKVSTSHDLKFNYDNWNLRIAPSFKYNHSKDNSKKTSVTLKEDMGDLSEEVMKNIFKEPYRNMAEALVNRNIEMLNNRKHGYNGELALASKVKIPGSPDGVEIKANVQYDRASAFGTTLQDICFGGNGDLGAIPSLSRLQQRDKTVDPDRRLRILALGRYYFTVPTGSLNLSYEFIHTQKRDNNALTLLEATAQGSLAEFVPGMVPVEDPTNSFSSMSYKNQHHLKLIWKWKKKYSNGELKIGVAPSYYLERHDLFYRQDGMSVDPRRTFGRFKIEDADITWNTKDNKIRLSLYYDLSQDAPNLLNMVDIPNTTDPLNIRLGNPDLKMKTRNSVTLRFLGKFSSRTKHFSYLSFSSVHNDFVNGYSYDAETGVRTYRMYNVNGNSNLNAYYSLHQQLDKAGEFDIRAGLDFDYQIYANMVGYNAEPTLQRVRWFNLNPTIGFSMNKKVVQTDIALYPNFSRTKTYGETTIKERDDAICGYASVHVNLPYNFSIGTNTWMVKYYGYSDHKPIINWDANLKYSALKGALTFCLEAKDILKSYDGYRVNVSANDITRKNELVLGRYVMLTVGYKFKIKPKRAK